LFPFVPLSWSPCNPRSMLYFFSIPVSLYRSTSVSLHASVSVSQFPCISVSMNLSIPVIYLSTTVSPCFQVSQYLSIHVAMYPCIHCFPVSLYPCICLCIPHPIPIPITQNRCIPLIHYPCIPLSLYPYNLASQYPCIPKYPNTHVTQYLVIPI